MLFSRGKRSLETTPATCGKVTRVHRSLHVRLPLARVHEIEIARNIRIYKMELLMDALARTLLAEQPTPTASSHLRGSSHLTQREPHTVPRQHSQNSLWAFGRQRLRTAIALSWNLKSN